MDFTLFDRVPLGIFVVDSAWTIRCWNPCMEDWTGLRAAELLGRDLGLALPRLRTGSYEARLSGVLAGGPPVILSYQLHGDLYPSPASSLRGRVRHTTVSALPSPEGPLALFAVEDRTEAALRVREVRSELLLRKRAEAELREALAVKELLIREVNHRVKNNLAMVASLVDIQADLLPRGAAREALDDVGNRIQSIALLYDRLYRGDNPGEVDIGVYLESIARGLVEALGAKGGGILLETDFLRGGFPVGTAINLGLVLTELLTNALKYGIGPRARGRAEAKLRLAGPGTYELLVADDGPGYPPGAGEGDSLGMRLVGLLAAELGGSTEISSGAGARFVLRFPPPRRPA